MFFPLTLAVSDLGRSLAKPEVILRRSFLQFDFLVWNKLAIAFKCSFILRYMFLSIPLISNVQRRPSLTNVCPNRFKVDPETFQGHYKHGNATIFTSHFPRTL